MWLKDKSIVVMCTRRMVGRWQGCWWSKQAVDSVMDRSTHVQVIPLSRVESNYTNGSRVSKDQIGRLLTPHVLGRLTVSSASPRMRILL